MKNQKHNKKKKEQILSDVISPQFLNIIDIRDKEIMVNAMKKMVEDLNTIDLIFSSVELKPEQMLRLRQFINNNKIRARKVIWGLTISRIKDAADESFTNYEDELKDHKNMMNQDEDHDG